MARRKVWGLLWDDADDAAVDVEEDVEEVVLLQVRRLSSSSALMSSSALSASSWLWERERERERERESQKRENLPVDCRVECCETRGALLTSSLGGRFGRKVARVVARVLGEALEEAGEEGREEDARPISLAAVEPALDRVTEHGARAPGGVEDSARIGALEPLRSRIDRRRHEAALVVVSVDRSAGMRRAACYASSSPLSSQLWLGSLLARPCGPSSRLILPLQVTEPLVDFAN